MSSRLADQRVARAFRQVLKSVEDLNRRMSSMVMSGRVAEVDGDRVRLELGPPDASGRKFLSPWVQVQEMAGATGSRFPVAVGDPMRLLSPNGDIGTHSLAIRDGYTQDAPSPAEGEELALAHDGCAIRIVDGKIRLEGPVEIVGPSVSHNERNIGDTHRHHDVTPGGALTGLPNAKG
ncbi:MAG: phage baseplate assembly protein V [Aquamicrobium sp.]|nr:phage baseplate assembly protein V [Aquamicrobium sp.]